MKTEVSVPSFDEIIFANRNQRYGAYQQRKNKERNTLIAFAAAVIIVSAVIKVPYLFGSKEAAIIPDKTIINEVATSNPPIVSPPPPQEIPKTIQQPKALPTNIKSFTEPVITETVNPENILTNSIIENPAPPTTVTWHVPA